MKTQLLPLILVGVLIIFLPATLLAGTVQLPKTGQDTCYDSSGNVINCTGTGQDGEIRAGVAWPNPRFTEGIGAESNCVTDNLTGLMWSKSGSSNREWYEAIDYANNFTLCGYSDWRLPNVNELESLINVNVQDTGVWLATQGFSYMISTYWSSTASYGTGYIYPWGINITDGFVDVFDPTYSSNQYQRMLPVRSGQSVGIISLPKTGKTGSYHTGDDGDLEIGVAWPNPRFTEGIGAESNCVTDNLTGLMWPKTPDNIQRYWQQALDYSNGLTFCGYSDWRLPNRKELLSLSSYSSAPIDNLPFTNVSGYYWSSTTDKAVNTAYALVVGVNFGGAGGTRFGKGSRVERHNKSYYYGFNGDYVWPVRSGEVREAFDYYCDMDFDGYISVKAFGTCTGNACIPADCQIMPGDDCNDNEALVNPGTPDTNCNTIDENCSGTADEGYVITPTTCGVGECANTGQLVCQNGLVTDNCVSLSAGVEGPYGAPSCSDGADNDCNNQIDLSDISCIGVKEALLPRTGQTKCYNGSGVEIDCSDTGQDGDIRAGFAWPDPRFTEGIGIETECMIDNLTGLMWPRNGNLAYDRYSSGRMTWNDAIDYSSDLTLCGHDDWRLPNINELESLFNAEMPNIADWLNYGLGFLSGEGFFNVASYYYYSSTTCAGQIDCAWSVFMGEAYGNKSVDTIGKKEKWGFVWPVRSEQPGIIQLPQTGQKTSYRTRDDGDLKIGVSWPNPRFVVNGYCVVDNLTRLMWTKRANFADHFNGFQWSSAVQYANNLVLCGYSDWRLPNRKEIRSFIDYSNYDVALPTGHPFINVKSGEYWSSTLYANNTKYWLRWLVDMSRGYVDFDSTGYPNINFWPVRSGQVGGSLDYYCDDDNDGYISFSVAGNCIGTGCQPAGCQTLTGDDCNDDNFTINPGALEICIDNEDNDCDGQIDEADDICFSVHPFDSNNNWIVDDFELLGAIDDWAVGNLGDFELLDLIDFWAVGCYHWDTITISHKAGC